MKRLVFMLAVVLFVLRAAPIAQAPIIGPTDAIGFDYSDTDVDFYAVYGWEASYDGAAFAAVTATKFQTVSGISTYKFVPPQVSGTHSVVLRTCGAAGCGPGGSPFAFAVLASSNPPTAPTNIRRVPR